MCFTISGIPVVFDDIVNAVCALRYRESRFVFYDIGDPVCALRFDVGRRGNKTMSSPSSDKNQGVHRTREGGGDEKCLLCDPGSEPR